MAAPFTSKKWGLWVQPDGPNTIMRFLGCHDVDDVEAPGEGIGEIIRCFKADGSGWEVRGTTITPPEMVTTTVTTLIEETADWLEKILDSGNCEFPFYLNGAPCPPNDVFPHTSRSFLLERAKLGTEGLQGLSNREEDNVSTQSFEVTAWPPLHRARGMTLGRQQLAEYAAINDVHFLSSSLCASDCNTALPSCSYGIAVADSPPGSPAEFGNVWYTQDGGALWTVCVADPFVAGEDIVSGVIFQIGASTYRLLVARAVDGANPMEVAYSDDWGANWTLVVVSAVGTLGANLEGALFALNPYHIWLCLDTGYVYFSGDFGITWTLQAGGAGAPTAADLNEIWFADAENGMAVGDDGAVIYTTDGGDTWTLGTQPNGPVDLLCVSENTGGIWWVGDIQGNLWYSLDQGTTWTQRGFTGDGVGAVNDVEFVNTLVGFLLHDDGGPVGSVYRTRNGGTDWELMTDVINAGLNSLHGCHVNLVYAGGEVYQPGLGGTAVVLKGED